MSLTDHSWDAPGRAIVERGIRPMSESNLALATSIASMSSDLEDGSGTAPSQEMK